MLVRKQWILTCIARVPSVFSITGTVEPRSSVTACTVFTWIIATCQHLCWKRIKSNKLIFNCLSKNYHRWFVIKRISFCFCFGFFKLRRSFIFSKRQFWCCFSFFTNLFCILFTNFTQFTQEMTNHQTSFLKDGTWNMLSKWDVLKTHFCRIFVLYNQRHIDRRMNRFCWYIGHAHKD